MLFAFGAALGLGMVSPEDGSVPGRWLAIAAGLWFVCVVVTANVAGGYLAGRMRRRTGDATPDESDTRDGANGLTVWAVATLIGAMLATSGVSTDHPRRRRGGGSGDAGGGLGRGRGCRGARRSARLLRRPRPARRRHGHRKPEVRQEVGTILARSLRSGEVSPADRDYMVNLVAAETATPPEEVGQRVDAALQQFDEAQQAAIDAAEAARVAGIISAFAIAATLFVAAAAAYMAAVAGGKHRDENIAFRTLR